MYKQFIILICLLLLFTAGGQSSVKKEDIFYKARQIKTATLPDASVSSSPNFSVLSNKEKLVYKAKFLGISIGKFTIINYGKTKLHGQDVYSFELTVKTLPFFSILFKTKDRYVSYMDAQRLVVLRHEEYIDGGTRLESVVDFDYQRLKANYKNFLTLQESSLTIPEKTLDVLSGSFYLRMEPLELGDTVDLNVYADGNIYNLTGLLMSKTKVSVSKGKQDAYLFKPFLFQNDQQIKKISAEVFFSITTPRKTLHATLKTLLGSVHVVLVDDEK